MSDKIKVMLTTEGTYPFHQGGVSTWCDILVKNLVDVDFVIYSVIMNPFVTQKFTLPNETEMIKVPLWGTEEPSEHLDTPFSQVYLSKKRTTEKVIGELFIPLFKELIEEVLAVDKNPVRLGNTLFALNQYFQTYEYKNTFKSEIAWNSFKRIVLEYAAKESNKLATPNVYALIQSLGWIYRFLNILNTPIPDVQVCHSAAAAFCGIPCVLAKIKNKTPYLLTEHGVYIREQYLSLSQRGYSSYLNTFLIRLIHSITALNFHYADQVSPVCEYNTRWEKRFGVDPKNIKVIYNGVDKSIFTPSREISKNKAPTVVSLARIDPIKDILSLIEAAEIVKEKIPDVKFIVYGSVSVPKYFDECKQKVIDLKLSETFIFAGHTNDIASAYKSGDMVALSSISEAFPYSVVEAMMVGKPVIATDVGGIKEAIGECGIVVSPRQPEKMASGIIRLLEDPELRATLGEEGRQRALNYFTIGKVMGHYLKSYINLAAGDKGTRAVPIRINKQKLMVERGYALLSLGHYEEAITQFRMAIKQDSNSAAVPAILLEVAEAYNHMGKYEEAENEMEKAEMISEMMERHRIA